VIEHTKQDIFFTSLPTIAMKNRRQLIEFTSNVILFAIVVLSWTYAIVAGRFVSLRHLQTLDLSEYQMESRRMPQFGFEENGGGGEGEGMMTSAAAGTNGIEAAAL
jgi:hypothetical protein